MTEVPQPQSSSDTERAESLDWSAVADNLEQQGQHELAAQIRIAAQNQPKNQPGKVEDPLTQKLDERQKAANQSVVDQLDQSGLATQSPSRNVHIFNTQERGQVQKIVEKLPGQQQPPSVPNGRPNPPGGR